MSTATRYSLSGSGGSQINNAPQRRVSTTGGQRIQTRFDDRHLEAALARSLETAQRVLGKLLRAQVAKAAFEPAAKADLLRVEAMHMHQLEFGRG